MNARRDENRVTNASGVSSIDKETIINAAVDPTSQAWTVSLVSSDLPAGIQVPTHDYGSVAYPDTTTEIYTFKVGGASGTVVATITLTFTDATKASLSTWSKT